MQASKGLRVNRTRGHSSPKLLEPISKLLRLIHSRKPNSDKVYIHNVETDTDQLARALLPYFYTGHDHLTVVLPCWEP